VPYDTQPGARQIRAGTGPVTGQVEDEGGQFAREARLEVPGDIGERSGA
jgi:hypothetical protein